ncbi:ABC transporter ATP-binding protein [Acuticoccus sp. 2012]|uniref:ABC transporter ATP-binding protein n=2 Tax=Acuticoccus mangrovi TaxID=2796142 RepID=A0A934ITJ2_9HYPH|nr:ABC transporter ATP-binding protein [Acuticoccus mangrovi]
MSNAAPLLDVQDVSKIYGGSGGLFGFGLGSQVRALDGVALTVGEREIVGLVGESGSGKSTLGRLVVGLERPTSGHIILNEAARPGPPRGKARSLGPQIIFQNAVAALNPRRTVKDAILEPAVVHGLLTGPADAFVHRLMDSVGLPASLKDRRPHELSGGQCQRVVIARALAASPKLLVCDEPVSALDVSIQAQVLNLFLDLYDETGCSYLFISHDLPVVERLSHRIAIMYLGRIVESAPTKALFAKPLHPYTEALIASVPDIEQQRRTFHPVSGEIPSPLSPPSGCHFHPRCPHAMDVCRVVQPPLLAIEPGHFSACHLNTPPAFAAAGASGPLG